MKKKVIFMLFSILLFTTACNVNYDIKQLSDGKIKEEIILEFSNDNFYYDKRENINEEYIDNFINDKLKEYKDYLNISDYDYELEYGSKSSEVKLNYTYSSIREFKDKNIADFAFDELEINSENGNYNFLTTSFNGGTEDFLIDNLTISLYTDNILKNANNTSGSEFTGKYQWNFPEDDVRNIEFVLTDKENWKKKFFGNAPFVYYTLIVVVCLIVVGGISYIIYLNLRGRNSI